MFGSIVKLYSCTIPPVIAAVARLSASTNLQLMAGETPDRDVTLDQGDKTGPKVGQIVTKWDKSETFSDQISVHFGAVRQNVLKSDLKKSRINLGQI